MRRFLLISGFLLLLLVLLTQTNNQFVLSFQGKQPAEHSVYAAIQAHSSYSPPKLDPICLTAPQDTAAKQPLLNFCSPIYEGIAAGPYGVHITLWSGKLPGTPTAWFISKEKPQPNDCGSNPHSICSPLPEPLNSTTSQPSLTLFSWTWKGKFPHDIGTYYITAQLPTARNKKSSFVSTSESFQLLTSQSPCISLNKDSCISSQIGSIDPSKPLTFYGKNWLLQQNQTVTTETILLTVSCIQKQSCSNDTLTETVPSDQIDAGIFTFRWTLPTKLRGNYHISATNFVPSITNTVASQTLSFGMPGDSNGLDINIAPAISPPSRIDVIPLNIAAFLAMLPALAGIFTFLFLWSKKNIFAPKT